MNSNERGIEQTQRDLMLKVVAKGFYRELIKYGVARDEIVTVATNLLGHVSNEAEPVPSIRGVEAALNVGLIKDDWVTRGSIEVLGVELRPLTDDATALLAKWLKDPEVRGSFIPAFPADEAELSAYLAAPNRDYLGVFAQEQCVGIIGADHVDHENQLIEMKKLVGARDQRGLGVGTRATFAFLYYAFMVRGAHKVYVHFTDANIRNLNLNSRLGFELEGLFVEELQRRERRIEVLRMALLKPRWLALFSRPP